MKLLIVTSVEAEARAIGDRAGATVVVAGVGRVNAAAATTQAILRHGPFDLAISAGIAGSLPGSGLAIGDGVIASESIYVEEGVITPSGFQTMSEIGFPLGPFAGNSLPGDAAALQKLVGVARIAPIATVATCSGTDAAAALVVRRTSAIAEAMEGAAVIHVAMRLSTPGLEIRTVSNTTGDRQGQRWDVRAALQALGELVNVATMKLRS